MLSIPPPWKEDYKKNGTKRSMISLTGCGGTKGAPSHNAYYMMSRNVLKALLKPGESEAKEISATEALLRKWFPNLKK